MDDLVTWLLAALVEDERAAQAASPGPWRPNAEHDEVLAVDDITVCEGFALSNNQLRATVDHIVAWDPERVLAECEAKRRVIKLYRNALNAQRAGSLSHRNRTMDEAAVDVLGAAIQAYGAMYAKLGRPGYREDWRP